MAYQAKGKEEVISVFPLTDFTDIRVTRVEDETGNTYAYDIRQWYCTQSQPEKKPSKGIRINEEMLGKIINALLSDSKVLKDMIK